MAGPMSKPMPRIEWRSVLWGAAVTLVITVPPSVAGAVIADDDGVTRSNWSLLAFGVIVGGFVVGGFLAAIRQPHAPLAHGALAATLAHLLVRLVGTIRRL